MTELMDLRLHQQIAHEIYRQQMLQRLPDPYPTMLPVPPPRQLHMPPRYGLPNVSAKLQNADLWSQFHNIGTEMIITKSGRRMFPSLRVSVSGLENDANYCVLLEMIPIGDCRYKFSGTQWVPAGGAEPQSTQRMYLHPDSPALGSHWSVQPILFNKVKLTNNTLDNSGHIVLTSMHKYQPRLHIIRTSDPGQIPWAPQQSYTFPETEFVAVTAYQNDRITKLKIDNNPFAKGFRESGQSRCKRKMVHSSGSVPLSSTISVAISPTSKLIGDRQKQSCEYDREILIDSNVCGGKRKRLNSFTESMSSLDDSGLSISESSSGTSSPVTSLTNDDIRSTSHSDDGQINYHSHQQAIHHQELLMHQFRENIYPSGIHPAWMDLALNYFTKTPYTQYFNPLQHHYQQQYQSIQNRLDRNDYNQFSPCNSPLLDGSPFLKNISIDASQLGIQSNRSIPDSVVQKSNIIKPQKKCNFTISAILGCES